MARTRDIERAWRALERAPVERGRLLPARAHLEVFLVVAAGPEVVPAVTSWVDEELGYWVGKIRRHGRKAIRALRVLAGIEDGPTWAEKDVRA